MGGSIRLHLSYTQGFFLSGMVKFRTIFFLTYMDFGISPVGRRRNQLAFPQGKIKRAIAFATTLSTRNNLSYQSNINT
jgi:hypothetical protein